MLRHTVLACRLPNPEAPDWNSTHGASAGYAPPTRSVAVRQSPPPAALCASDEVPPPPLPPTGSASQRTSTASAGPSSAAQSVSSDTMASSTCGASALSCTCVRARYVITVGSRAGLGPQTNMKMPANLNSQYGAELLCIQMQHLRFCEHSKSNSMAGLAAAHLLALLLHCSTHALQAGRAVGLRMLEAALAAASIPITFPHALPDTSPHTGKHASRPATSDGLCAVMHRAAEPDASAVVERPERSEVPPSQMLEYTGTVWHCSTPAAWLGRSPSGGPRRSNRWWRRSRLGPSRLPGSLQEERHGSGLARHSDRNAQGPLSYHGPRAAMPTDACHGRDDPEPLLGHVL